MSNLKTLAWVEAGKVRTLKGEIEKENDNEIVMVTLKKRVTLYKRGNIIKKEEYLPGYDNGNNGDRFKYETGADNKGAQAE